MESSRVQIERVANRITELFGAGPSLAEQIKTLLMKEFLLPQEDKQPEGSDPGGVKDVSDI